MRPLYTHTCGRVRVYCQLSSLLETMSAVRKGCSIFLFSFNFVIDEVVNYAVGGLLDVSFELVNGEKSCGLDWADDHVCVFESMKDAQCAPDRLPRSVARFGTCCALSRCKVLLQASVDSGLYTELYKTRQSFCNVPS